MGGRGQTHSESRRGNGREMGEFTRALRDHDRAPSALDAVMPIVYQELRALAAKTMSGSGSAPTLQPTALVNEAYVRLSRERNGWTDRENFMIAASVAMRRALVDHVRARTAQKRDGRRRSSLDVETIAIEGRACGILAVEETLSKLEREDPESAQVVELLVFGGATAREAAGALGVSERTVQRRWRFARAWLAEALSEGERG